MTKEIAGWHHVYSGKVRDLYESNDPSLSHLILVVASDRVSAFDHVLEPAIPNKGKHLTTLTNWWFDRLPVENHVSHEVPVPVEVQGRATVAKKLEMFPIECVVRGYISGSGWKEYQDKGEICGVELPEDLTFGGKLPRPIFTPAFKPEKVLIFYYLHTVIGSKHFKEVIIQLCTVFLPIFCIILWC